ncbi:MAG: triphosphoribosyl-dephospho-CoA synthase CitG [Clostridia bacterium]|nr:triphosphoribosyl-dephospho-CoA synthase CitG [Clostridia bacterium]
MANVTLNQVLQSREERVKKQQHVLNQFGYPLISFTMNIAGPVKTSPIIERAFFEGVRLLKESLCDYNIAYQEIDTKITGCEAIFSVNADASNLKSICTNIEDSLSIGRLFDMDVIDTDGNKLERNALRGCFVCGAPGRTCAASRAHSVDELQAATKEIIENYFFLLDREQCATLATKSLLDEVYTTPKPGLVDGQNNGSHSDMDLHTFEKSAHALKPYFGECFSIGKKTADLTYDEAFSLLRNSGIQAEQVMYSTTGGANTHKGAIYSLGILCASIGRLWSLENPFADVLRICLESANIAGNAIKKDFEQIDASTAGGSLYLQYGITGIRGEVASGFESVLKIGLPCYKNLRNKGFTQNDAGAITLLHFIANIKDTNIYHRGGIEGAKYATQSVISLLNASPEPTKEQIEFLDDDFIKRNLSPGGCADLLAVTYFLYSLKQ